MAVLSAPAEPSSEAAEVPAAPPADKRALPALLHDEVRTEQGHEVHYVTAEGTMVKQTGRLVPTPDGSDFVMVYEGEFIFTVDGKTYITKYKTDIAGAHQPSGDHLPKAPEPQPQPQPATTDAGASA